MTVVLLLGLSVALVCIAVVAYPFVRPDRGLAGARRSADRDNLVQLRSDLYTQIEQLQADRAAGAVTEDDYRAQLRELRIRAAAAIRELERFAPDVPEEAEPAADVTITRAALEEEIARLRRARSVRRRRHAPGA